MKTRQGYSLWNTPVEQGHYFGGWVDGAKSLWCPDFADRQTYWTSQKTLKCCEFSIEGEKDY